MSAAADKAKIPSHVPPELVYKLGITESPEFLAAPHEFMAGLHATHPPILYNIAEHSFPSWYLLKYEDAYHVLRHPELFTTEGTGPFPRDPDDYWQIIPIEIEPPEHRKYRAIIDPLVSPRTVLAMEASIRALANELIDSFIDKGECEFAKDFGRPLPVGVFLDIMGLPRAMMDEFVRWAMGLLHAQDQALAVKVMAEVTDYLGSVIAEKAKNPDAGAISAIVHGKVDGKPLPPKEIFGFVFFLFIAGLDTVFATLNNIFVWLAEHPDRRAEIIAQPDNIGNIVEEFLRIFGVTFSGRMVREDTEMRGIRMKRGDRVMSVLPTCNYDPDIFPNPTEVNFHRPRKPVLSFAGGAHSCLGAHLARLEVKICIQEFLRRIPDFQLKPGSRIEYWPGGVVGPKTVPLVW